MDNGYIPGERLIRNSVLSIINSLIAVSIAAVSSIIVARILKPANYGIYNLVLWFTGIASWLIGMGLINAVTKYVAEYRGKGDEAAVGAIIRFVLKIEVALTVAITVILLFFRTEIADYFFSPRETFFFVLAFLGLLPGIVTAVFASGIEGMQKFEYFTYFQVTMGPLAFASKMAALYLGYRVDGILIVTLFFSFVNALYYFIVLRRERVRMFRFRTGLDMDIRKKIRSFNLTVSGIMLSSKIVWDKSENLFLGRFCSSEQIGYYNLAYNVVQRFMSILPDTFWKVLFPAMAGYFGSGDLQKIRRVFYLASRYLAFFSFPVGIAGIVLAYPIIHFLYGDEFIGAKYALQVFFFSTMITSLSKPGSAILYATERQGFILKYGLVLAALNILLDILFIPRYGAIGAAVCCGLVTMAGSVGGLIYTCRTVGLAYPFRSLFKVLFAALIMGICMKITVGMKAELFGFIASLPVGAAAYLVCATVFGSFEEEDYVLLNRVKSSLPRRIRKTAGALIDFLSLLKEK